MKKKEVKQQEPIELVTFEDKVMVNFPRTMETMIKALQETTSDVHEYYTNLNKNSDQKHLAGIQTLNNIRGTVAAFDSNVHGTIINLASNQMLTFEMEFCQRVSEEFKEILAEFKKKYPKQAEIFFESLKEEMKLESDDIIGYFDHVYTVRSFILGLLNDPALMSAVVQAKDAEDFFKSALYGTYFDQFIMLYYSGLINNYRTIWFNAISKCILELDGAPVELIAEFGTQAIEAVSNEKVFSLEIAFGHIINVLTRASFEGNTAYLYKMVEDNTNKLWKLTHCDHGDEGLIEPIDPADEDDNVKFAFF